MRRSIFFKIILFLFILSGISFAKDIHFEASLEKGKISLGNSTELYLTFYGTQDIPAPNLPGIDGFESRYLGPSTRMSVINGQVSTSVTHVYTIAPLRVGTCHIGPLSFVYKGDTYTSNEIMVEVLEGPVQEDLQSQVSSQDTEALKDRIFLVIQPGKTQAYLNDPVTLSIKLYVNRLAIRDIQYPEFGHEGLSIGEFEKPRQYRENLGGVTYDVIEFNTSFFGTHAGEFKLGPARLKCNVVVRKGNKRRSTSNLDEFFGEDMFDDFFDRFQAYPLELESKDISMRIYDLPGKDRPQDFSGAVGDFTLDVTAQPQELKVGDVITLKMVVGGRGNFNSVNCPKLESGEGFKTYEPQTKFGDGTKTFEIVLMPKSETIKEIAKVNFNFFNPRTASYQTISKGPFPIKVTKPDKEEQIKIVEMPKAITTVPAEKETLGRDIVYIKDSPGRLKKKGIYIYKNKLFILFHILILVAVISIFIVRKQTERLRQDVTYARYLKAHRRARRGIQRIRTLLSQGKAQDFYYSMFKTMQQYFGDKFHLASRGITASIIDDILKNKGISQDMLDKLKELFRDCDMARFSPSEFSKDRMEESFKNLEEVIEFFENRKI